LSKLRVALVQGGRSGEHEISLRSAKSVGAALTAAGYEVLPYVISKQGQWSPAPILPQPGANAGIDVVFPVLHGTFGEDGTLQGLLEMADLPYVGPGVFASSASMDKAHFKRLCLQAGLPVVEYQVQLAGQLDVDLVLEQFELPVFVKPANLGSSVGISKAHTREELQAALELAARYDTKILVERTIVGQELECAVLGNAEPRASMPCEVLPSKEFYDYEDKYLLDKAQTRIPPALPQATIDEVRRLAVACFRVMDCAGMARVDFLVERSTGQAYINEINTIPGFTSISMYPQMWKHGGLELPQLVDELVQLALERHQERAGLRFEL